MEPRGRFRETMDRLEQRERCRTAFVVTGGVLLAVGFCFSFGYLVLPTYQIFPSAANYGDILWRWLQAREAFSTAWYPALTIGSVVLGGICYGLGIAMFVGPAAERDGVRVWDVRVSSDPGRAWIVRCRVKNDQNNLKRVRLLFGIQFFEEEMRDERRMIAEWKKEQSVDLGPRQACRVSERIPFQPQTHVVADEVEAVVDILEVT